MREVMLTVLSGKERMGVHEPCDVRP
jgi:hypothetical protein